MSQVIGKKVEVVKRNDFGYAPFEQWKWRSYDGKNIIDIDEFIAKNQEKFFFIGTDSQNYTKHRYCNFTSVLIAYGLGKGGNVILHRDRTAFMPHLRQRLLMEAMRSLEVAMYTSKRVPSNSVIEIHLDVNQNLKFKSGQYKDELVGMVAAQGFRAITKPDAFAASKVADHRV